MPEMLTTVARTMGFSFAAGINLYATVAITRPGPTLRMGCAARAVSRLRQRLRDRRGAGPVCDRVLRRQGALAGFTLGRHSHADSARGWRPHRRCRDGAREPDRRRFRRPSRRNTGGRDPLHEGQHTRRRQHQPRAVLQLGAQPGRRRVRHRPLDARAEVPAGRGCRGDRRSRGDGVVRDLDRPRSAPTVAETGGGGARS